MRCEREAEKGATVDKINSQQERFSGFEKAVVDLVGFTTLDARILIGILRAY